MVTHVTQCAAHVPHCKHAAPAPDRHRARAQAAVLLVHRLLKRPRQDRATAMVRVGKRLAELNMQQARQRSGMSTCGASPCHVCTVCRRFSETHDIYPVSVVPLCTCSSAVQYNVMLTVYHAC